MPMIKTEIKTEKYALFSLPTPGNNKLDLANAVRNVFPGYSVCTRFGHVVPDEEINAVLGKGVYSLQYGNDIVTVRIWTELEKVNIGVYVSKGIDPVFEQLRAELEAI